MSYPSFVTGRIFLWDLVDLHPPLGFNEPTTRRSNTRTLPCAI